MKRCHFCFCVLCAILGLVLALLLMGAPSEVSAKQLRELHIRVVPPGPGREGG